MKRTRAVPPPAAAFVPTSVRCLRLPADGTKPQFVQRETVYVNADKLADCFLYHVPDMRMFWNAPEPGQSLWHLRTLRRVDVTGQPNATVDGHYYFFRCCHEQLPRNPYFPKTSGVKGDVFVVKAATAGGWTEHADYVDVPVDLLEDKNGRISLKLMMTALTS
ncbi:hypothetical protein BDZ89DRAFT_1138555 [Hymenopellis radicata]|nr:hypothetical protein BDZ89DRAFT_1138555 [Hymenopellis radicata]